MCRFLYDQVGCRPETILEPTAGEGHFLRAALAEFPGASRLYGVEIQPAYASALRAWAVSEPRLTTVQDDIFRHDFPTWLTAHPERELLILGNPPWVTSAELATLNSGNLPVRRNFKDHAGLDALTGKGNFDLAESVILKLLETFHHHRGYLALLCKQAVVRNLLQELPRRRFQVAEVRAYAINAARHFGAAVEAALLVVRLGAPVGAPPAATCTRYDWEAPAAPLGAFGWTGGRFVADVAGYERWRCLDGRSPYEWRQGIKHDCARVMELRAGLVNGYGEPVDVEPEALCPLLKSSDLRRPTAPAPRLWLPLPQRRLGDDTAALPPKLLAYLEGHREAFAARKSRIYRGRPPFAIFGVGDYSFAPYKVAISGMYKEPVFTLVQPVGGRPVMLDDTCYFLGFADRAEAVRIHRLLSSEPVQGFLRAAAFRDAKRPYTKELLMRIDLRRVESLHGGTPGSGQPEEGCAHR